MYVKTPRPRVRTAIGRFEIILHMWILTARIQEVRLILTVFFSVILGLRYRAL